MNDVPFTTTLQLSLASAGTTLLNQLATFTPRLLSALVILILGSLIARWLKAAAIKGLEAVRLSKGLAGTPIEAFLQHAEAGKVEVVLGSILYWLILLFVIQSAVYTLGLATLSAVLDRVLSYLPSVLSAAIVLVFGILLAGLAESFVKGAIRSVNGTQASVFGKLTSYLVMTVTLMAAIAELRIAQQFISTLFTGLVATIVIAVGLAVGLGGKDIVHQYLQDRYAPTKKVVTKTAKK